MRYLFVITFFVLSINLTIAQNGINENIINDNGAIISAKAEVVDSGECHYSHNENARIIPASLLKVTTTATSLELLGEGYRYETEIGYSGKIKNGVLHGNLIIKSGSDVTLGSRYFTETNPELLLDKIVFSVKESGIKIIEGDIIIKGNSIKYPSQRLWEDMGNYYGGAPKSFNWKDNTATITLQSKEVGEVCNIISIVPDINPYQIDCRVIAASHTKDSAYVYGITEVSNWWMEGSIPAHRTTFKVKAALPNPSQTFKNDLITYLNNHGLIINGDEKNNQNFVHLFTYQSPPLADIIKITNHKSNNLFADQLLLTLAKEFKGMASWDNGISVIKEFWRDKIDFNSNFRMKDGSGLSPKNLASANGMVQILSWMHNNSKSIDVFEKSLAKGGESGTLKTVFKDDRIKGRIIGKSGSMEGVLGYCGYYNTSNNKQVAFCIIVNNYLKPTSEIRKSLDQIITSWLLEN